MNGTERWSRGATLPDFGLAIPVYRVQCDKKNANSPAAVTDIITRIIVNKAIKYSNSLNI